jgi:hypothetical protein
MAKYIRCFLSCKYQPPTRLFVLAGDQDAIRPAGDSGTKTSRPSRRTHKCAALVTEMRCLPYHRGLNGRGGATAAPTLVTGDQLEHTCTFHEGSALALPCSSITIAHLMEQAGVSRPQSGGSVG